MEQKNKPIEMVINPGDLLGSFHKVDGFTKAERNAIERAVHSHHERHRCPMSTIGQLVDAAVALSRQYIGDDEKVGQASLLAAISLLIMDFAKATNLTGAELAVDAVMSANHGARFAGKAKIFTKDFVANNSEPEEADVVH